MSGASGHKVFPRLRGVFAVYKHGSVSVSSLSRKILHKLVTDLNTNYVREQKTMVQFKPREEADVALESASLINTRSVVQQLAIADLVPVTAPDLFDHSAVQGPRYHPEDFKISTNYILDSASSGVQVFGLQAGGIHLLKQLYHKKMPRSYRVHGRFGVATTKFDRDSKVIEKSTWDHITKQKINTFLGIVHGSYRNALLESSGLDLDSQHAYEMASKGLLKPENTTGPIILSVKLHSLDLPEFVIDITCMNESCQFLREVIDEIGASLRSSAVCTSVHRYRDGIFFAEDESTLLSRDVNVRRVIDITSNNFEKLMTAFKKDTSIFSDWTEQSNSAS